MSEHSEKAIYTERLFVTSEIARQWLRRNIEHNRPIQQDRVRIYARDMKNGHWRENGETIIFSVDGGLIDGQHRLAACVECGVGFWTLVAYGVKPDAFITIDRGQSRTHGQMLYLADGISDYNAVAATLTWLYRFRDGIMLSNGRPTTIEAEELLHGNPGIPDSVKAAHGIIRRFRAGPVPVVAVCHYLFTRQDATLAEAFFDALASGASLREIDPVYQLRARIISASSSTAKKISSYELVALMFKTWLAEREQRTMKVALRWAQAESFPNIGPVESVHKVKPPALYVQAGQRKGRRAVLPKESKKTTHPVNSPDPPKSKLDLLIEKQRGLDGRQ